MQGASPDDDLSGRRYESAARCDRELPRTVDPPIRRRLHSRPTWLVEQPSTWHGARMRRRPVVGAIAVLVIAVLTSGTVAARSAQQAVCGKLLAPSQGVYFGVMPGWRFEPVTFDDVANPALVGSFTLFTGRRVVFAPWSISWHDGLPFPRKAVRGALETGLCAADPRFHIPRSGLCGGCATTGSIPGSHHVFRGRGRRARPSLPPRQWRGVGALRFHP